MKFFLLFLLFFSSTFNRSFAQLQFQMTYGDSLSQEGLGGGLTKEGGYFIAGLMFGPSIVVNFGLVKIDSSGNLLWSKTYGTTGSEYMYAAVQTADSGYLLGGTTDTSGNISADAYLVRVNGDGSLRWSRSFAGNQYEYITSILQTADSGFIIAGNTRSFGAGGSDMFLMKTDSLANIQWARTYGGIFPEDVNCIVKTKDDGFILAGSSLSFGSGGYDAFVVKTDNSGNLLWSKTYGGTNYEYITRVIQLPDNDLMLIGATGSFGTGDYDGYLIRTDSIGNLIWSKTYGASTNDNLNSIRPCSDGGFILSMRSYSFSLGEWNGLLIKTNDGGDTLWTRAYGGTDYNQLWFADQVADGGYIAMGFTSSFGQGSDEFYLIKTDAAGHSGCNEKIFSLTVTSPLTLTTVPAPATAVPAFSTWTPATTEASRGIQETQCFFNPIGVEENEKVNFTLFPNPVPPGSSLHLVQPFPSTYYVEIIDMLGRVRFPATKVMTGDFIIKAGLESGIYLVRIFNSQKSYSELIMIE